MWSKIETDGVMPLECVSLHPLSKAGTSPRTPKSLAIAAFLLALAAGCGPTPPTLTERTFLLGHKREVVALAFAPDGKSLLSRGADAVKVWDLHKQWESFNIPSDGSDFGSLALAPDGRTLASAQRGIGAVAWELETGTERARYGFRPTKLKANYSATRIWGLAYSPDGKILAGGGSHGGEDGFLTLWDTSTGDETELGALRRPVTTVAFSPDGKTIASGSMDGKLVFWDTASRSERLQVDARRSYLAPVSFSPDGQIVATTDDARFVTFWDVATGQDVGTMKGHMKAVLSLAFSPDGRTLVSADSDGTLFVWDVSTRRKLTFIECKDRGKVWSLAFSPDGKTLASSGEDRRIHLWDVTWPISAEEKGR
jgi:WD40 repeat protein